VPPATAAALFSLFYHLPTVHARREKLAGPSLIMDVSRTTLALQRRGRGAWRAGAALHFHGLPVAPLCACPSFSGSCLHLPWHRHHLYHLCPAAYITLRVGPLDLHCLLLLTAVRLFCWRLPLHKRLLACLPWQGRAAATTVAAIIAASRRCGFGAAAAASLTWDSAWLFMNRVSLAARQRPWLLAPRVARLLLCTRGCHYWREEGRACSSSLRFALYLWRRRIAGMARISTAFILVSLAECCMPGPVLFLLSNHRSNSQILFYPHYCLRHVRRGTATTAIPPGILRHAGALSARDACLGAALHSHLCASADSNMPAWCENVFLAFSAGASGPQPPFKRRSRDAHRGRMRITFPSAMLTPLHSPPRLAPPSAAACWGEENWDRGTRERGRRALMRSPRVPAAA